MLSSTPSSNFQGSLHDTWYNDITAEALVSRHPQDMKKVSITGTEVLKGMQKYSVCGDWKNRVL